MDLPIACGLSARDTACVAERGSSNARTETPAGTNRAVLIPMAWMHPAHRHQNRAVAAALTAEPPRRSPALTSRGTPGHLGGDT
ncbi:Uncharacterised protein [Mycobacteroides abscessus subsp. abscessus]|nr:Uncharacterised protein [Mycobacteroides abscessus subsp. abscessus]